VGETGGEGSSFPNVVRPVLELTAAGVLFAGNKKEPCGPLSIGEKFKTHLNPNDYAVFQRGGDNPTIDLIHGGAPGPMLPAGIRSPGPEGSEGEK